LSAPVQTAREELLLQSPRERQWRAL